MAHDTPAASTEMAVTLHQAPASAGPAPAPSMDTTDPLVALDEMLARTARATSALSRTEVGSFTFKRRQRIEALRTTGAEAALEEGQRKWAAQAAAIQDLVDHLKQQVQTNAMGPAATGTMLCDASSSEEDAAASGAGSSGMPCTPLAPVPVTADAVTQTDVEEAPSVPVPAPAPAPEPSPVAAVATATATAVSEDTQLRTALQAQVAELQATVAFYTTLTGLEVTRVQATGPGPMFYMQAGPTSFSLGPCVDGEPEELEFAPMGGCDTLPDFLQESIAFAKDQAPLFLSKVIEALHADQEGRGEEEEEEDV